MARLPLWMGGVEPMLLLLLLSRYLAGTFTMGFEASDASRQASGQSRHVLTPFSSTCHLLLLPVRSLPYAPSLGRRVSSRCGDVTTIHSIPPHPNPAYICWLASDVGSMLQHVPDVFNFYRAILRKHVYTPDTSRQASCRSRRFLLLMQPGLTGGYV
ncbi:uncharacterized protein LY79DRAFT_576269 [Colletotrichum navitas]|uniref:Secreted protein n=1 Tax=Colletotrichum navitas TaxID=681940 RepID=A0AAD8Q9K0_9PEZI|nr:uncharacterized protein LY79DRAFT_576269 [Colletotrichum navitas]KAK1597926.1 hypothetical protein LY79DRAFT_576269 [Colletotrichum navitas]